VRGRLGNCSYILSFVLALCACVGGDATTSRVPPQIARTGPPSVSGPVTGSAGSTAVGVGTAGNAVPSTGGAQAGAPAILPQAGSAPSTAGTGVPSQMRTFNAGSDPDRNMVQAGQVCARLAEIQCAGEEYCCENPGRDVAACVTKMTGACTSDLFVDAITLDSRAGFDAMRAADALQTFEDLARECNPMIADFGADPDGLMAMVRGTVASGGRCSPSIAANKAQQAGALASCRDSATTACLPMSALSWTCAPRAGVGANCFSDFNCTDGNYCPNPDLKINMTQCLARKADGAACVESNECLSLTCVGGSCAPATKQSAYCLQ
jgi:hypothetical protein